MKDEVSALNSGKIRGDLSQTFSSVTQIAETRERFRVPWENFSNRYLRNLGLHLFLHVSIIQREKRMFNFTISYIHIKYSYDIVKQQYPVLSYDYTQEHSQKQTCFASPNGERHVRYRIKRMAMILLFLEVTWRAIDLNINFSHNQDRYDPIKKRKFSDLKHG